MTPVAVAYFPEKYRHSSRQEIPIIDYIGLSRVSWKPCSAGAHDLLEKVLKHKFLHSSYTFDCRVGMYRGFLKRKTTALDVYALLYRYAEFDGHRNEYSLGMVLACDLPPSNHVGRFICPYCGNTKLFLGKELSTVVVSSTPDGLQIVRRVRDRAFAGNDFHRTSCGCVDYNCKECGGVAVDPAMVRVILEDGSTEEYAPARRYAERLDKRCVSGYTAVIAG